LFESKRKEFEEIVLIMKADHQDVSKKEQELVEMRAQYQLAEDKNVQLETLVAQLKGILAKTNSEVEAVQTKMIALQDDNDKLKADLTSRNNELSDVLTHLQERTNELEDAYAEIERRKTEDNSLQQMLADNAKFVQELEKGYSARETQLNETVDQLKADLASKETNHNEQVQALQQQITEKDDELNRLKTDSQQELEAQKALAADFERQLRDAEAKIQQMQAALVEKDKEIENLKEPNKLLRKDSFIGLKKGLAPLMSPRGGAQPAAAEVATNNTGAPDFRSVLKKKNPEEAVAVPDPVAAKKEPNSGPQQIDFRSVLKKAVKKADGGDASSGADQQQ